MGVAWAIGVFALAAGFSPAIVQAAGSSWSRSAIETEAELAREAVGEGGILNFLGDDGTMGALAVSSGLGAGAVALETFLPFALRGCLAAPGVPLIDSTKASNSASERTGAEGTAVGAGVFFGFGLIDLLVGLGSGSA